MLNLHVVQINGGSAVSSPVVLITGALTGIGRATALAFAREGARVVVSGRHDDQGQKLAAELRKLGTEAKFLRTDVRHEEEVKNLVDKIIARFGRLERQALRIASTRARASSGSSPGFAICASSPSVPIRSKHENVGTWKDFPKDK